MGRLSTLLVEMPKAVRRDSPWALSCGVLLDHLSLRNSIRMKELGCRACLCLELSAHGKLVLSAWQQGPRNPAVSTHNTKLLEQIRDGFRLIPGGSSMRQV